MHDIHVQRIEGSERKFHHTCNITSVSLQQMQASGSSHTMQFMLYNVKNPERLSD